MARPRKIENTFNASKSGTPVQFTEGHKSKGILDDYAVRGDVATKEGTIQHTPTEEKHIVNKEYVDSIATKSVVELFLTENGSVSVGGYFDLEIDVVTATKESITQSITAGSTTLIASFVTKLGEEEINAIEILESGIYNYHAHANAATAKNLFLYYEFYHRTAGGTETLLGTSHNSNELTTSEAQYELHASIIDERAFVSGDRIVIKVYGRNTGAAARNVTIYMEGDTASRVEFPAFISSTFVPAHTIASHSDTTGTGAELDTLTDNSMADTLHRHSELSASDGTPDKIVYVDANGKLFADAAPTGIDILYSADIGAHLSVGNNITAGGSVVSGQKTIATDTDALDVAGVNSVLVGTAGGNVTIGGLANGVTGQVVHIIKVAAGNSLIIEFNEATGTQKILTPDGLDITLSTYGGVTMVYSGSFWYVVSE